MEIGDEAEDDDVPNVDCPWPQLPMCRKVPGRFDGMTGKRAVWGLRLSGNAPDLDGSGVCSASGNGLKGKDILLARTERGRVVDRNMDPTWMVLDSGPITADPNTA